MKKPTVNWEQINQSNGIPSKLFRAKVFGGWLVKSCVSDNISLTFIPDPSHDGWMNTSDPYDLDMEE